MPRDQGLHGDRMPELPSSAQPNPIVLNALQELDARRPGWLAPLAEVYRAARRVLADVSVPDRFAVCAHELRELIEKAGACVGVVFTPVGDAKRKLRDIISAHDAARSSQRGDCRNTPEWDDMCRLLGECEDWLDGAQSRVDHLRETLLQLDVSGVLLPVELLKVRLDWLKAADTRLQDIAHHRQEVSEEEMWHLMADLESLIVDLRRPETVSDRRALDEIINEGETDADA